MITSRRLMHLLGYAGLIPFVAFAVGVWAPGWVYTVSLRGFVLYSMAILCFLSGSLWGSAINYPEVAKRTRLLWSNALVVCAVIAVLGLQWLASSLLIMAGHLAILRYERQTSPVRSWYSRLRTRLTTVAVITHLVYAAGIVMSG